MSEPNSFGLPIWKKAPLTPRKGIEYRKGLYLGTESVAVVAPSLGMSRIVYDDGEGISLSKVADIVIEVEKALAA